MSPGSALRDWLSYRAATTPDRQALIAGGRGWTFAQLDASVTDSACRLRAAGARDGDRVATLLRNGAHAAMLVHAAPRAGATLVPLNVRLGAAELAWQLGDAGARIMVAGRDTAPLAHAALAHHPAIAMLDADADSEPAPDAGAPLRFEHAADDVHTIVYTSGTTGRPKGAMLTFGNHWWNAIGSALNLGIHHNDRWLACMPLFHVGGQAIVLRSAIYGITAVVHDGFDPAAVNRALDEEGVTLVSVVTTMLQRMLDARRGLRYPPSLRCVLLGGGPAPRSLLDRCAAMEIPIVQTYGLTETSSQVVTLAPEDALRKAGAAGKPLYPNELRIETRDGAQAVAGVPGEILVRGPVVMAGYSGRKDATQQALRDGWLHTGDVGYLDDDGYLYVLDRREDLIVTGGENVYPAEVEGVLAAHPAVAEAGVIGAPDDVWGQRVVAVVRLVPGLGAGVTPALLRAHCRDHLGAFKVPAEIRLVEDPLPRNASGKLRRAALREPVRPE